MVRDAGALDQWSNPVSHLYHVSYKNLLGMTVVDFSFRILFTPGGQLNGSGRYLTNVNVVPAQLNVAWFYTFDSEALNAQLVNVGTSKDPIVGAEIQVKWVVKTPLRYMETSKNFFLRGDGGYAELSPGRVSTWIQTN